jgi:hypothetical protein
MADQPLPTPCYWEARPLMPVTPASLRRHSTINAAFLLFAFSTVALISVHLKYSLALRQHLRQDLARLQGRVRPRILARPRKHHRGVDLISDVLPFGRLWYGEPNAVSNAIGYAKHRSRSHDAVIRVYDESGNVIETHEHAGEFKEW